MKIVVFKNGKFGVRKLTLLGYRFLNLQTLEDWEVRHNATLKYIELDSFSETNEKLEGYLSIQDKGLPL